MDQSAALSADAKKANSRSDHIIVITTVLMRSPAVVANMPPSASSERDIIVLRFLERVNGQRGKHLIAFKSGRVGMHIDSAVPASLGGAWRLCRRHSEYDKRVDSFFKRGGLAQSIRAHWPL
jgi:hypothetical protein